ncbi:MarR family transcriptional regulator [Mycolicibacterium mengxianglii]|uniref:MarR family transcriptional regulator n=1 Tax=Mycolicibacterium mengxianglii TaxID=2736649 RepID=UPI0027DA518D|nr:MarR family transcriptional regulator [Mycolicibacterium mengxianglii]
MSSHHPVFTPSAAGPAELEAQTVGRTHLIETLVSRIKSAARDGSRPHTLLIAPRGGGKTHTMQVTLHRVLADRETAERLLLVAIPEDSLAIGSYADLLVEIARALDPDLAETARTLRLLRDPVGIEAAVMAFAAGRMVLLAVENLDRIFDGIGPAGQGSLRAWVETSTALLVFATAPRRFPGVSSREYPWYGSFSVEPLPGLNLEDAATLLRRAAQRRSDESLAAYVDTAQGRDRLSAIHHLAGGSPRIWQLLSENVDAHALAELTPAVQTLLDRLAPYYQHQLWQLPAGEQRLVVELARGWTPRTVSDLAAAVGVSNQSASAALGRLATEHWVTSSKATDGDRRTSWYDLTEPLLRYHVRYRDNGALTENDIRAATPAESRP